VFGFAAGAVDARLVKFSSRTWLNLVLVVVVAALAALVYFKPGTKKPDSSQPLVTQAAAQVHDIRVELPGEPMAELTRAAAGWQLTAPLKLAADGRAVQDLLDELTARSLSHFPAAGADLKQYGLNPPKLKLWLDGDEYDFGDTEPLNNHRYVRHGADIHLSDSMLFYRAGHGDYWWAEKRLLPAGAKITALQLPDASLSLDKSGKWQLAPRNDRVSADALQQLVDNWQNASAVSVTAAGKGASEGEVALTLAGVPQAVRFAILKDENYLVLERPDLGVQYELDRSQRAALLKPAETAKPVAPTVH
jgi:hypothetical protein